MMENDNFECRKEDDGDIICERDSYGKVVMPGGRSSTIVVKGQVQTFSLDPVGGSRLTGGTANDENVTDDYKITRQYNDRVSLKRKKLSDENE